MPARKFTRQDLRVAAEKYKNWGKWGPNDEIGTLNYTAPEDIVAAAQLVRKGKVISLALNFDQFGPQGGKTFATRRRNTRTGASGVPTTRSARSTIRGPRTSLLRQGSCAKAR